MDDETLVSVSGQAGPAWSAPMSMHRGLDCQFQIWCRIGQLGYILMSSTSRLAMLRVQNDRRIVGSISARQGHCCRAH